MTLLANNNPIEEQVDIDKSIDLNRLQKKIEERQAQFLKDLEEGKAIECFYDDTVCELEYCQSFCRGQGCTHLKTCWKEYLAKKVLSNGME